jgi:hypothetical protein
MNERITQLAEQATEIVEMVGPQGYASSYAKFDREKFAELIVEECVAQCWTVSAIEHKGTVISECSKRMRKHFGVDV